MSIPATTAIALISNGILKPCHRDNLTSVCEWVTAVTAEFKISDTIGIGARPMTIQSKLIKQPALTSFAEGHEVVSAAPYIPVKKHIVNKANK